VEARANDMQFGLSERPLHAKDADSNSLRTAVLTGSRTLILMIADSCR
jgi:hypothetical protein